MGKYVVLLFSLFFIAACGSNDRTTADMSPVDERTVSDVISRLEADHGTEHAERIRRGVEQVASLWRDTDGDVAAFEEFCAENFISDAGELDLVFDRLARNFEHLYGYLNRISLELNRPVHEDIGPLHAVDRMFSAFSPGAHVTDDLFCNRIAFYITLNFPYYSLGEKNNLGGDWNDRQWGYARLGDYFNSRVPPALFQQYSQISSRAGMYISEYNIIAGRLLNNEGETLFPEGMRLLAHWNIRDEIKSNYGQPRGQEKQEMLYNVMLRIINQDIPEVVINNDAVQWNPFTNVVLENGEPVDAEPEGSARYAHLNGIFNALKDMDPYYPEADTYVKRSFDLGMEISQQEVEGLFREYVSSPLVARVGELISERLGRPLRPYDIWYDGFKARSSISEEDLDRITKARYPDAEAMNRDLPRMLVHLGFDRETADYIGDRIEVDAARGSGHAWRASMRGKPSHLRTRIGSDGMDYKGYNIAVHEFGHNVEQTISVYMVDNYFVNGIPNTAFTEALAFMFQARDLELLGLEEDDPMKEHFDILDFFWNNFEMMGVSLVDMNVWKWMYDNPSATPEELKDAVISIANEVWNEYFAPVFGETDIPLLAIYSHMIQSPLYLSNYPYGRLIMFQLEEYIEGRDFADEVLRIFSLGNLTPRHWMDRAVGGQISNQPMFNAVENALQATGR
ncbi:MAG: hypothetical protein EA408_01080 [Marinilabiliales bacterium]|nr:MAG: hypothetical protein EA408_01080 [Marinilabiliales bacterium]